VNVKTERAKRAKSPMRRDMEMFLSFSSGLEITDFKRF